MERPRRPSRLDATLKHLTPPPHTHTHPRLSRERSRLTASLLATSKVMDRRWIQAVFQRRERGPGCSGDHGAAILRFATVVAMTTRCGTKSSFLHGSFLGRLRRTVVSFPSGHQIHWRGRATGLGPPEQQPRNAAGQPGPRRRDRRRVLARASRERRSLRGGAGEVRANRAAAKAPRIVERTRIWRYRFPLLLECVRRLPERRELSMIRSSGNSLT